MNSWDPEGLWLKARVYIDRANECDHTDEEFPLWSSLALELLARAALTKVHPALNADPREDTNLLYAFGFEITSQPRSLPLHSVFLRLEKIVPGYGKPQRELSDFMALLRNQELHTADLPFENLKVSKWLPRFYEVAQVLCGHLGKTLDEFVGAEVADSAAKLINTLSKEIESAVKTRIAAHRKVFESKTDDERNKLLADAQAVVLTVPHGSVAATCPACRSQGILRGDLIKELKPVYEDYELRMDQQFLAAEFNCPVCGLHLRTVEEVSFADFEPRFSQSRITSLHELYEPEWYEEYDNM
jgi:predicted RNA-binding Zn-ribbon protein involved in translation (DUF1610 family)